ncbi:probable galacturonosyltransferase 7 isoform X2 [Tanacetum coccineum]
MSDNIPFDIQMEIVKKVSNLKSLIQFRSVSKLWKSFIDGSEFINGYGVHHTQPHSHILSYRIDSHYMDYELKYICLVEDNIETFKVQQQDIAPFVVSPLLKEYQIRSFVGACHGLLCLYCFRPEDKDILVIWNPSIGKSFGIALPECDLQTFKQTSYGFGVCPVTNDPTVVKFVCADNMPWHVEVFTLSSGVWNVIPSGNLPRQTISLETSTQVVIDKFIYWGAREMTNTIYVENHMVVSFDLITQGFKVVNLPHTLKKESLMTRFSISKLRGSLVVCKYKFAVEEAGVWVMGNDSSFRKLFTVRAPRVDQILGFKKNGEVIFKTLKNPNGAGMFTAVLDVYDPCSQQIKNLGISGLNDSFFMGSYKESLLLLDHLDSHIYYNNNRSK